MGLLLLLLGACPLLQAHAADVSRVARADKQVVVVEHATNCAAVDQLVDGEPGAGGVEPVLPVLGKAAPVGDVLGQGLFDGAAKAVGMRRRSAQFSISLVTLGQKNVQLLLPRDL